MNNLEKNNKRNLDSIKQKFSLRISKSLENAHHHLMSNQSSNSLKIEEARTRPLKGYQNWVILS